MDRVLRDGSAFGTMDFATRDRYRHAIEDLARGSGRTETDVAREALALAGQKDDPGLYLISKGRPRLEEAVGYRVSLRQRLVRAYMASGGLPLANADTVTINVERSVVLGTNNASRVTISYPFSFMMLNPVIRLVTPGSTTGEAPVAMGAVALMRNEN